MISWKKNVEISNFEFFSFIFPFCLFRQKYELNVFDATIEFILKLKFWFLWNNEKCKQLLKPTIMNVIAFFFCHILLMRVSLNGLMNERNMEGKFFGRKSEEKPKWYSSDRQK